MERTSVDTQYDDPFFVERRAAIVRKMEEGGYWAKVMSSGPELDRVKEFLLMFAGRKPPIHRHPRQRPRFLPVFPDIHNKPFHDPSGFSWTREIEAAFPAIRQEMLALEGRPSYIEYSPEIKGQGTWEAFPFYFMGLRLAHTTGACPKTTALLERLPRFCGLYPWADMLFSRHAPGTHLVPHCSIDALRLRCHMGLVVPEKATIRVDDEERIWQEGKVLLFEDSFEHETWNRGASSRTVLIVDFWHPDLTDIEIQALLAGFRKSEVRSLMYDFRFQGTAESKNQILQVFGLQDQEDLIRSYWNR